LFLLCHFGHLPPESVQFRPQVGNLWNRPLIWSDGAGRLGRVPTLLYRLFRPVNIQIEPLKECSPVAIVARETLLVNAVAKHDESRQLRYAKPPSESLL
jgi:hypothetical protein